MLAILFPINIAVINSLGFGTKANKFSDFLSLLYAFVCSLILFVAVNAVSLPEKKKETNNKTMIAMITCRILLIHTFKQKTGIMLDSYFLSLTNIHYKFSKNKRTTSAPPIKIPKVVPRLDKTIISKILVTLLFQNPFKLKTSSERFSKSATLGLRI